MTKPNPELVESCWAAHVENRSEETLEALVILYEPLARYLARRALAKAPPYQDGEDILSYAHHGLLDALSKFEPQRGLKFETYATRRIAGSIIDGQRRQDPLTRTSRKQVKLLNTVDEQLRDALNRHPTVGELANALELDEMTVRELLLTRKSLNASLDALLEIDSQSSEAASALDAFAVDKAIETDLRMEEIKNALADALTRLSPRARAFVVLYYCERRTLREIGRLFGLHETRTGQIRVEVLQAIKAA